jgi:hypothetical protein
MSKTFSGIRVFIDPGSIGNSVMQNGLAPNSSFTEVLTASSPVDVNAVNSPRLNDVLVNSNLVMMVPVIDDQSLRQTYVPRLSELRNPVDLNPNSTNNTNTSLIKLEQISAPNTPGTFVNVGIVNLKVAMVTPYTRWASNGNVGGGNAWYRVFIKDTTSNPKLTFFTGFRITINPVLQEETVVWNDFDQAVDGL